MMGCGKSTVGVCLAEISGRAFRDTDSEIVAHHGRIADIFERFGEEYFRDLETRTVKELAKLDNLVIATGGGLVLRDENVKMLKESGKIVYLRAQAETLLQRLQADKERPLLQNSDDLKNRVETLLKNRAPIYESAADIYVEVDGETPEEIAKEIIKRIGQV